MPQPIEVKRLAQAIEQFKARAPRDLPDGVLQGLEGVEKLLGEAVPHRDSPGASEAQKVSAEGTGVHFSQAAKGSDQPTPGQREALTVSEEISQAAAQIVEKARGGERTPSRDTGVPSGT